MRSGIIVIGRDLALRSRLAGLLKRGGYRVEVAESVAHARRAGLGGIALAIIGPEEFGAEEAAAADDLRAAVDRVLLFAPPGGARPEFPDIVDASDESALLVRVAEALALKPKPEATEPTWEFAGYRFDLAGHSLNDPSGKEVPLRRSEFRLLRVFVECAGRVLSRDQLLNLIASRDAEPYERSVDMQISRLRCKIESDLRRPSLIVTVPGSGYKFAAAVREAKPREPAPDADPTTASVHGASSPAVAAKRTAGSALSIVVLPFANIGGDPTQDYFTDGVTESLTTDLSRIRDSFVIARNTAFAYKGKPMDVRVIGRELNVRYVLEGSVQRSGDRMRVSAQLIDAESGGHLWAERFDESVADLFDLQDAIVGRIANMLNVRIVAAEARRAERTPTSDSMDLYFRGMERLHRGVTRENAAYARAFLERAVALDAGNVDAIAAEAIACFFTAVGSYSAGSVALFAAAETAAVKALTVAPDYATAHYAMGLVLTYTNRAAEGVAACARALALNRNLVVAHATLGAAKVFLGRSEETEAHIHDALRLSPRDPSAFHWIIVAGGAAIHLGRDEAAIVWLRRSIEAYANYPLAHVLLAAALGNLGRLDEARRSVETVKALDPTLSIKRLRDHDYSDNAAYLATRERIIEGLRKAGAPGG